ncbi:MAG: hypothetical protein LBQ34_02445 [Alphaproteobacteria bacterium]|jgi:phospholipase/carboxylesterase|nr:hypothetical protein [Alphaproteobacteria bacterium]
MNKSPYKTLKCLSFCANKSLVAGESSEGAYLPSCNPEDVKHVVVLLHGYGSNAEDLISIAPFFKNMENTLFVAPNAPYEIEGFFGRQWFPLITKENANGGCDVEVASFNDVKTASNLVIKLIEEIQQYHGLDSKHISLFGFSQGGILSLYTALNNTIPMGAIVSHSGIYYDTADVKAEDYNNSQKILMVHGEDDEVLPLDKFYLSVDYLKSKDIPFAKYVEPNLAHSINPNTIEVCEQFLLKNHS